MDVREGDSIVLFNAKAEVVNEHIEIQLDYNGGRMETARRPVEKISEEFDLSSKAWVPIEWCINRPLNPNLLPKSTQQSMLNPNHHFWLLSGS